jgi:tetratricopeptide (TPR) repeat protein
MNYKLLSAVALILFVHSVYGQKSKNYKKKIKEADEYFNITDYVSAIDIYKKLYENDSTSAELSYKIGACHFLIGNDKQTAFNYLKKSADAGYDEANYYLARCYHSEHKFDEAIFCYKKYSMQIEKKVDYIEIERWMNMSIRAKELIRRKTDMTIENIGAEINSEYNDYVPLINADETVLMFTSRRKGSTGNKLDPYGKYFEDVYISNKVDGKWNKAENIGPPINTETHDACVGLSPDGTTLILYRTSKDLLGGDLYWSELEGNKWSAPQKYADNINSPDYQEASASITANGNTIYFSSNRPGGQGGKDIYRVVKFGNGDWSLAQNIGNTINTPYDEDAPYIHPDGKTLYFSSNGHTGMGGYDIFQSTLNDDGTWSTPENLGYPVNNVEDDIYFVLSAHGSMGYYSSEKKGGLGGQDIYTIYPASEPRILVVLKGKILTTDGQPLKARIIINETPDYSEKDLPWGEYNSNSVTGKYMIVLPVDKKFYLHVESPGFQIHSEEIEFNNIESYTEKSKDFIIKSH